MAQKHKRTSKKFSVIKLPMQWYTFVLFIGIVVFVLIYQEYNRDGEFDIKRALLTWTVPVVEFLSAPVQGISYGVDRAKSLIDIEKQHQLLQQEAIRLQADNDRLAYVMQENEDLRNLMNLREISRDEFITARIISDTSGTFHHTLLLNAGTQLGAEIDMPVIADNGIVGRIIEVGANYSRVLLLTDWTSRIPAIVENVGVQGIVAGRNTTQPGLIHISHAREGKQLSDLFSGMRVLTSGRGGLFPPGLAIGRLQIMPGDSADASHRYQIIPFVNSDNRIFLKIYIGAQPLLAEPPQELETELETEQQEQ